MRLIRFTPTRIDEEDSLTVACNELGLAASGPTIEEAGDRLRRTVESYLRALSRRDDLLEKALSDSGLRVEDIDVDENVLVVLVPDRRART